MSDDLDPVGIDAMIFAFKQSLRDSLHHTGPVTEENLENWSFYDALKAAIRSWEQAKWRDIESAPKDGSLIMIGFYEGGRAVAFWRAGHRHYPDGWTRVGFEDIGMNPPKWRLLPPPPSKGER